MAIGRRSTREGQRITPLSERSMVNEEHPSTSKETMQWKAKTEERKKRLGMLAISCPVRQQHEIRQKKEDKREKARRRSSEPLPSLSRQTE